MVWGLQGRVLTGQGERVDRLTMTDAHSRYLLRCQSVEKTNTEQVQAILAAALREYGMPQTIRTDNGAPLASRAIAGIFTLIALLDEAGHQAGADQARSSGAKWAS